MLLTEVIHRRSPDKNLLLEKFDRNLYDVEARLKICLLKRSGCTRNLTEGRPIKESGRCCGSSSSGESCGSLMGVVGVRLALFEGRWLVIVEI